VATITQVQTFTAGELLTPAKLNNVAGTATVSAIVNADIDAAAGILDTKLASITTAGKVNVTALTVTSIATGDMIYYSGTAWVRLPIGTVGQTLKVSDGIPAWVT